MRARFLRFVASSLGVLSVGCQAVPDVCQTDKTCDEPDGSSNVLPEAGTTQDGAADDSSSDAPPDWQCCGDEAGDSGVIATDAGATCGDASFCGPGQGCVDTTTSATNCGSCGHSCAPPADHGHATCSNSACNVACEPGYEPCNGQCISTNDLQNCGGCNNACPSADGGTPTCVNGGCGLVCTTGFQGCPTTNPTACVSVNDPKNCGQCGKVCTGPASGKGSASCQNSQCGVSCNASYHACNGDCLPDSDGPSGDPCVVDDAFGIFVSPAGADSGSGSRAAPVATIAHAVTLVTSTKTRVFVCAGTYPSAVTLTSSSPAVTIYGGFDCSTWAYDPSSHKAIVAPTSGIPLTISAATSKIEIDDIEFDAAAVTAAGGSSFAAFVSSSPSVLLRRVTLIAADAKAGGSGASITNWTVKDPTDPNIRGNTTSTTAAAPAQQCPALCADNDHSGGGAGGDGTASGAGKPGTPNLGAGAGGFGGAPCGTGGTGHDGNGASAAKGGVGAASWGSLTSAGWSAATATDGATGGPGQGGGGGGGNVGGGGGGGCGGCGGGGGTAGQSGGSSIALLSFSSSIVLDASTLKAGGGGVGGQGGDGQAGEPGGVAGNGSPPGCQGGTGGNGGAGGGGGGGAGGLSASIGYVGTPPSQINGTSTSFASQAASGGQPGAGGSPAATKGRDGTAQAAVNLQ